MERIKSSPINPKTSRTYNSDACRWRALKKRDPHADGQFVYGVRTTGIYCRPTCPSRLALRKNITFHATCADAEQAGFLPCKRCQPSGDSQLKRHGAAVTKACRILEDSDPIPPLNVLAALVGFSRYHFHRIFKQTLGITPRQYAISHRAKKIRSKLISKKSITEAIYSAGFNSSSRFYEHAPNTLGMTPSQFRSGGNGIDIRYAIAPCSLGLVMIAGTKRGICLVTFGANQIVLQKELRQIFPKSFIKKPDRMFANWVKAVVRHIENPFKKNDVPLDIIGTTFQQRVWQALREIPVGQTMSYKEIATFIGQPLAPRAVARACATNSVAMLIPCHRVIGVNGKLRGYRWGVKRKHQLLQREKFCSPSASVFKIK